MALSIASARVDAPAAPHDAGSAGDGFSRAETVFLIGSRTWRMRTALLVSLLVHALLLSLSLGGDGSWLPGLRFPWEERRLAATDLQIVLAPAQPATEAPATAPAMPRPAGAPPSMPTAAPVPARVPAPRPAAVRAPPPEPVVAIAEKAEQPTTAKLPDTPAVVAPARPVADSESVQQAQRIAQAAQEAARQEQLQRDSALAAQAALAEAMRRDAESREQARQETLRQEALRQEQARVSELARQDAARREQERAEAGRQDAARQEQARQEQARQVRARDEALRQEQARLAELAQQEAARQELERAEAARQDAIRQEAARQAAARQEAARQEAARQEAARQEQAQRELAQREASSQAQAQQERAAQEAKREERLRAIGRQLDQEARQRDAANAAPGTLPATTSGLRRGWLLGRADPNRDLILYAEAMARKIELNPTTIAMVREVVKQPHVRPAVTVAVRADGSVERVTFTVSSNVPAIDDAIRKVIASQAPYGPFPPALARQYDVVEIRRTWIFDVAIRLE